MGKFESISAFEIIKIGIGPSSSHTMGPWRAAERFLDVLRSESKLEKVEEIHVHLFGSLAKTGIGHGTDVAVMLGLSGEDFTTINTNEIPKKIDRILHKKRLLLDGKKEIPFSYKKHILFDSVTTLDFHPNGMRLSAKLVDGDKIEFDYFSIGGGFVVREDDPEIRNHSKTTKYPCHNAAEIIRNCRELNLSVAELVFLNEQVWRKPDEIKKEALLIWNEMKECIYRGICKEGYLPGGLNVRRRSHDLNIKRLGKQKFKDVDEWISAIKSGPSDFKTINKWISIFALAVNEENASFGRIVTAPTNGASGVLPAVLMYAYCFEDIDEEKIIDFIITAGEIGTLYKKGATISAAMGGCQAEIGVSSSMAAGALTQVLGGKPEQVMQAAEMAMEHHLGMTCDPIKGLVQVPCIERNTVGAMKAVTASNITLDEEPGSARVSLDDVIRSMWETAKDMNTKYKETSEGGLATISVNVAEC